MSTIMEEHELICDIMDTLTHYISTEVQFDILKSRLVRIFPRSDLQRAEGRNKANIDIMIKVCDTARNLSMPDFLQFAAAVKVDYQHVYDRINKEYREKIARDLPTSQEYENGRMTSSSTARSQNAVKCLDPHTNAPALETVSRSSGLSALHTGSSNNLASSEIMEPNLTRISYVSYGQAVPCPSDEISLEPTVRHSSAQFPQDTAGNSQGLPVNRTPESLTSNQNQDPLLQANQDQEAPTMVTKYEEKIRNNPDSVYRMDYMPRGHCVIINNEEFEHLSIRRGSNEDSKNLERTFKFLGFNVSLHRNKTAKEMKDVLKELANSSELGTISALSVVILSHGGDDDCVYGYDGAIIEKRPVDGTFIKQIDLQQIFNSRNCRLMNGKPKLFILQACRGVVEDERDVPQTGQRDNISADDCRTRDSQGFTRSDNSTPENLERAETADMCFLYASSQGYKAYRSPNHGSPFVQVFTEAVMRSAHEKSLLRIFMEVQKDFSTHKIGATKMTMPFNSTSLTKKWYLNPPE